MKVVREREAPARQAVRVMEEHDLHEADARIRTADPFITSEVLYQLSYVGEGAPF